jgi:membrane-associated protease RseP (regulator of RpoE activity)
MIDFVFLGWLVFLAIGLILLRKHVTFEFPILLIKSERLGEMVYRLSRKWKRILAPIADFGVFVGFLGMAFCVYFLVKSLVALFTAKAAGATVSIIIPGVKVPGSAIFLPFTYGIISIALLAAVHEFAHAIVASSHGVKPKSIALALMLFIPAAGVEIDEKKLAKHPLRTKLRIFAAGSFANFLFALLVLGLSFGLAQVARPHMTLIGTEVVSTDPATNSFAALPNGTVITTINGVDVRDLTAFSAFAGKLKPGELLDIRTADGKAYQFAAVAKADNSSAGRIGVTTRQKASFDTFGKVSIWILGLFQWLFTLNIGVAIINLFPFPIMDGGRMVSDVIKKLLPKYYKKVTFVLFCLTAPLLLLNILIPIIKALFFK